MELTEQEIETGMKLTEYFLNKYGKHKTEFILSRIASAVKRYPLTSLVEMGEKIALFNGWNKDITSLDNLYKLNHQV